MATSYTLTMDTATAQRIAADVAYREVTDITRRVLNLAIYYTPVDTGRLRAGNRMRVARTSAGATGDVFNDVEYAPAVHDGSRAHTVTIRPRRAKALRFVVDGEVVFAKSARVTIPARRGRPWLLRALREVAGPRGYQITT